MGLQALVIEDSMVFQKIISEVLSDLPGVQSVAVAGTGAEGLNMVRSGKPDVVFLDLHLPDMDGMDILDRIRREHAGTRVVVVSGIGREGAALTVKALSLGAQQFISKPEGAGFNQSVAALRAELEPVVNTVRLQIDLAARHGSPAGKPPVPAAAPVARPAPAPAVVRAPARPGLGSYWVVAVAVSTGGPAALARVIPLLPASFPLPVVIVQHMPPLFTRSLADSLDAKSQVKVHEGQAGDVLQPGHVYLAPGGRHMIVKEVGGQAVIGLNDDPPEQSVRPAADVLFRSLSVMNDRKSVLAVVMTGMGEDGLAGLRRLNRTGVHCLTQTAETCVVYGMPRAVDEAGLSHESVALDDLAARMSDLTATCRVPRPVS